MVEVMETDQRFFDYEDVTGTVVGLYCPVYMNQLNSAGWHFHFLADDASKGGHIVDLSLKEGEVQWDKTTGLNMALPEEERFSEYDFSTDQSDAVKKVEKPKD
jgi:acetolactate decarboxylase